MRQTLFVIPYEVGGIPLFGYGVLLVVWLAICLWLLERSFRRSGWGPETNSLWIPLLLVGAAIWGLPRVFPEGLPIRGYGVMLLLGTCAGVGLALRRAVPQGISAEMITSLAFWLVVWGVVGARIFHVVEYWESDYRRETWWDTAKTVINVPQGGLVVYGAFFGAAVGFVVFVRRHRLPALALADLLAPSLMVGLGLGRIGCLLNGCCYGGPTRVAWAVTFPEGSPPYENQVRNGQMHGFVVGAKQDDRPTIQRVVEGSTAQYEGLRAGDIVTSINKVGVETNGEVYALLIRAYQQGTPLFITTSDGRPVRLPAAERRGRSLPVHPAQIYGAVSALLLAMFLWSYYPLRRRDGEVLALLLTIYPLIRFVLEIIRQDEPPVFGTGLSISQNISLVILLMAVGVWVYVLRQPVRSAQPVAAGRPVRGPRAAGERSEAAY